MRVRKATVKDASAIHSIINKYARKDDMLPRSLNEIFDQIRDFTVCTEDGKVIAVCALHIVWEDIAEIRSIAVLNKHQGSGIGKKLINRGIREARSLGIKKVFALTYHPEYFKKLGFDDIDKNDLPHKVWSDCLKCPKFPDCNEVAVIKRLET